MSAIVLRGVRLISILAAFILALPASGGEIWTEDATAAMAQAAKEKKDLLIDFTGSDWCGWCIKLDKEVFGQDAFIAEGPKQFVFLKLDFPRQKQLSDELKKQNAEWQKKFAVKGYPTIILADATGKPYAQTGYRPGGPAGYLKHLAELRENRVKRDEALAKAAAAQGAEKAKLLDAALASLDGDMVLNAYGDVVDEIVKLDADGKAGMKAKYEGKRIVGKVETALHSRDFDGAIALADEALKAVGATGETAQELLFAKSLAFYNKKDKPAAKKALEGALAAAPDTEKAGQIKSILDRVFKDKAAK
jgi:thioredoxin-related protein